MNLSDFYWDLVDTLVWPIQFLFGWIFPINWEQLGKIAPIFTATIAGLALWTALRTLRNTKNLAKRRAAVDFFLKTEMDDKLLIAFSEFEKALTALRENPADVANFSTPDGAIRKYLNLHELLAVGIHNDIFDKKVCYDFWADTLMNGMSRARPVIDYVVGLPGGRYTYQDAKRLDQCWRSQLANDEARDKSPPPVSPVLNAV